MASIVRIVHMRGLAGRFGRPACGFRRSSEQELQAIENHMMLYAEELTAMFLISLTCFARTNVSVMRVEPRLQKPAS